MYMREPVAEDRLAPAGLLFRVGLAVTAIGTLAFGLFPAILTAVGNAALVLVS
jgi:hypothetical protein